MALPEDIIAKVRRDFSEDEEISILQLLNEYHQRLRQPEHSPRILRCIVFLADGSFDKFAAAVKLAQLDWRDLIVSAEYDGWSGEEHHVRNFNSPFVS
jgi:hypothetical protein